MKLVIVTQVRENYGTHDWNGVGSVPHYWKDKGGSEYILDNLEHYLSPDDDFFDKKVRMIVEEMLPNIESFSDYMTESIINFYIEEDSYLPEYEKSQLEYEGLIRFYEPRIDINGKRIVQPYDTENNNIIVSEN